MDTLLEEKRSLHEERDRIELAIVNERLSKKAGHRDKLDSEHRQKILLDRYMKCSKTLLNHYERQQQQESEKTTSKIEEGADQRLSSSAFDEFYLALKKIRDFYAIHSNEQVVTLANEFEEIEAARQIAIGVKAKASTEEQLNKKSDNEDDDDNTGPLNSDDEDDREQVDKESEFQRLTRGLANTEMGDFVDQPQSVAAPVPKVEKLVEFTDEEGYGRYLDLTKCHETYLQVIKREEIKPNYLTFLDKFDNFTLIDRDQKLTLAYKTYIEMLLDYFRDYCRRAKPLLDYQEIESEAQKIFEKEWRDKTFPGWFTDADRKLANQLQMIDVDTYRNSNELMALGPDCLKRELQVRGLKCGGTLEERANRLMEIRGKTDAEIPDSLRAPTMVTKKGKKKSTIDPYLIASMEAKVSMYAEHFNDHRKETIENVQRKQARTAEERNDSDEESSEGENDDDNDQGKVVYNPKNLPLGWDDKPIPYWLYKLHGLNQTYTCEICGNATYKGPKNFERHFFESTHVRGMNCLGIKMSKRFANLTTIEEVLKLWDKIKNELQKDKIHEEEFEDSQGNVVNRKTYEDLKRQGLL